jgi:DNA mismatch repair protein MSH4
VTSKILIAKILESRPGVLNLHLETDLSHVNEDEGPKMTMLHKVVSGYSTEQNYGLQLSKAIGFPDQFIHTAETVSERLKQQSEQRKRNSQSVNTATRRRLLLHLHESLIQLKDSNMDRNEVGGYMRNLQYEFVVRMDEIESGVGVQYE